MNIPLLLRTARYVTPVQAWYQLWYKVHKAKYEAMLAPTHKIPSLEASPIAKPKSVEDDVFTFLNIQQKFEGWDNTSHGNLWAYNQNYFDWLGQDNMTPEVGCRWIDIFDNNIPAIAIGLHPYPIALRVINWVKFFICYPECASKERENSLYSQLVLLNKKLEYHIYNNHLLEDAYALYIGATYFNEERLLTKGSKLLRKLLKYQVLPDGAHYEQSPMYHCILLDRLLDVINIAKNDEKCQKEDVRCFCEYAERMLGHLESIKWSDGSIPLLSDSAYGIAPTPAQIFDYARRLGLEWKAKPMKECGYRRLINDSMEAVVDIGNIAAKYQPGHNHADIFTYELRVNGQPFVVDTGISTYNKNARRQFERSTPAHNTVSVNGKDSTEVWGGFRVGSRASVSVNCEQITDKSSVIEASHNGFDKPCKRRFEITEGVFSIEDCYEGEGVSYIHLSPDVKVQSVEQDCVKTTNAVIRLQGASKIELEDVEVAMEYNRLVPTKCLAIYFKDKLKYTIAV